MSIFNSTKWLIEYCPICSSINHIFLPNDNIHAWECWFCLNKWWLNEEYKDEIVTTYCVDSDEADNMLINCDKRINFTFGSFEVMS